MLFYFIFYSIVLFLIVAAFNFNCPLPAMTKQISQVCD